MLPIFRVFQFPSGVSRSLTWRGLPILLLGGLLSMASAKAAAPAIYGTPSKSATAGIAYAFQPTASDADGDRLIFSITNKPGWAAFNSGTGRLSGTPTVPYTHSNIVISVSDGSVKSSLPVFAISVRSSATVGAPTIAGTPSKVATVGAVYSFQPSAVDPNRKPLTFSIVNKPAWAAFSAVTGRLSGTPSQPAMHSNIWLSVSNGTTKASLPVFSIAVSGASGSTNTPPAITGTPIAVINAGTAYAFQPAASDVNGDPLTFSIVNPPSWATFNSSTGRLSGTPNAEQVGTYSNVTISVSDGKSSSSLPTFAITVNAISLGSATLSWSPPTLNTDGSALTNLSGYRIYYGTSAGALNQTVQLSGTGLTTYVFSNLPPATYYFAVTAYNSLSAESDRSNVVSKLIN
jgi:hypothetical protein